jgi:AbrB family looped-hinge helix DNA binding protein
MTSTKLSTKGQIVIPKELRDAKKWAVGMDIEVVDTPDGVLLRPKAPPKPYALDDVIGILRGHGKPISDAELRQAAAAGAVARYERSLK